MNRREAHERKRWYRCGFIWMDAVFVIVHTNWSTGHTDVWGWFFLAMGFIEYAIHGYHYWKEPADV